MYVHPYAILTGVMLFIGIFAALRHPPFAIFAAFCGFVISDYLLKRNMKKKDKS